jgi:hypothetical protein
MNHLEGDNTTRVPITDDTGRYLGYAARVLDFTNAEPDPGPQVRIDMVAPGLSRVISRPRLPIRIGHVAGNVLDPGQVIATNGEVIEPGNADALFLDTECSDCDSALVVLPHQEPGYLWYVTEHRRSCPAFAQWIRDQR